MAPKKRKMSQERLELLKKARDKYKNLQKLRSGGCNVLYKKEEMQQNKRKVNVEQFLQGLKSVDSTNFSMFKSKKKPINPTSLSSANCSVEDFPGGQLIILDKSTSSDLVSVLKENSMHSVPEDVTTPYVIESSDDGGESNQDNREEEGEFGGETVRLGHDLLDEHRELYLNRIILRNSLRATFPPMIHRFMDFVSLLPSISREVFAETDSSTSTSTFETDEESFFEAAENQGAAANPLPIEANEAEGEEAENFSARHQRWLRRSRSSHHDN